MTFVLDPERTDLAREFKTTPYGLHSSELQALLNAMRRGPHKARYAVFCTVPGREWMLVQLSGEPAGPVTFHDDVVFSSFEDAEWHVFRLRWKAMSGQDLEIN